MENALFVSLKQLGYKGLMSEAAAFSNVLDRGPECLDYIKLVQTLAKELKILCQFEQEIQLINSSDILTWFLQQLSQFLNELSCPYEMLFKGPLSSRLQSRAHRMLLLDYLITELMAARIVNAVKMDSGEQGSSLTNVPHCATKDAENLFKALKIQLTIPNITTEMFFSQVENFILKRDDLLGKPLYDKVLTEEEWIHLKVIYTKMYKEYKEKREAIINQLPTCQREHFKSDPGVKISHFLAARTSLLKNFSNVDVGTNENTMAQTHHPSGGNGSSPSTPDCINMNNIYNQNDQISVNETPEEALNQTSTIVIDENNLIEGLDEVANHQPNIANVETSTQGASPKDKNPVTRRGRKRKRNSTQSTIIDNNELIISIDDDEEITTPNTFEKLDHTSTSITNTISKKAFKRRRKQAYKATHSAVYVNNNNNQIIIEDHEHIVSTNINLQDSVGALITPSISEACRKRKCSEYNRGKKRPRQNNVRTQTKYSLPLNIATKYTNSRVEDPNLLVVVTEPKYGHMGAQVYQVQELLENEIMNMAMGQSYIAPIFRGRPIVSFGCLKLWCQNEYTLHWLETVVSQIRLSSGQKLVVMRQCDIPRRVFGSLKLPGKFDYKTIEAVLKVQNPWAQVDTWLLIRVSFNEQLRATIILVSVPEHIEKILRVQKCRLYFGLGSIHIKLRIMKKIHRSLPPEVPMCTTEDPL